MSTLVWINDGFFPVCLVHWFGGWGWNFKRGWLM